MWVRIPVVTLVSLSKTLNHNCFVLRMGRKAVGSVCCVMHVKEPRTLIVKEKGLAPVFLEWQLNAPKALSVCLEYNYMYRVMRIWTYMEFAQYKCNIIIIIIINTLPRGPAVSRTRATKECFKRIFLNTFCYSSWSPLWLWDGLCPDVTSHLQGDQRQVHTHPWSCPISFSLEKTKSSSNALLLHWTLLMK